MTDRDVLALLAAGPTGPTVHRCACGVVVRLRGLTCEACAGRESLELVEARLGNARRSMPDVSSKVERFRKEGHERLRKFADVWEPKHGSTLIMGPAWAGKTTAAVLAVSRLLQVAADGRDPAAVAIAGGARFVKAHDLALARSMHGLGAGEPPLVLECLRASVLILDDIGEERRAKHEASDVDLVLRDRAILRPGRRHRPTIVTSGMTYEQLLARYGDGVARRTFDGGRVLNLFGGSK